MYNYMRISKLPMILLMISTWGVAGRGEAMNQTTAIMYEGSLSGNGSPVNGLYDLSFSVYDSAAQGLQVGASVTNLATAVTNGTFTVTLDFGGGVFTGPARWLEVTVSTNGGSDAVTLAPRQQITAVPYAAYASSAATATNFSGTFGGDISGGQGATVVTSVNGYPAAQVASGAAIANGGTSANSPSTLVKRDESGSFSASTISVQTLYASNIVSQSYGGNLSLATMPPLPTIDAKANFGAAGDGVTDDTAALQAALNYLGDGNCHSLHLYIPPGKYIVTSPLVLPPVHFPNNQAGLAPDSGFCIEGAGMGATQIINLQGGGIGVIMTNGGSYSAIDVSRIGFCGPAVPGGSVGLYIGAPGGCYNGNNFKVTDCGAWGWDYGVQCSSVWTVDIKDCILVSNRVENVRSSGTHNLHLSSCQIGGNAFISGIGVGFHYPSACPGDQAVMSNCDVFNCTNGVVNDELNLTVIGGNFEGNGCPFRSTGALTLMGVYVLDNDSTIPYRNGSTGLIEMDDDGAASTVIINPLIDALRPTFNVTGASYQAPTYLGSGIPSGLFNGATPVFAARAGASSSVGSGLVSVPLSSGSNWTNTTGRGITLYLKGLSGSLAVNGTDVTGSLSATPYSTQLSPGDWVVPTFTSLAQAYYK
jgi:Pectate lyase superfamily protein